MIELRQLDTADAGFWPELENLLAWEGVSDAEVQQRVRDILADVRARGDAAVVEYTRRFDRLEAEDMAALEIGPARVERRRRPPAPGRAPPTARRTPPARSGRP